MTKARDLGKLVSQGEVLADGVVQAAEVTGLASVATSGSYTDLTNKPALATLATSGSYADLTNKPALASVATSGSYADLTNKPTIPSVTGLASETFVSAQINNLVNSAPATLDTLKEIADQLAIDQSATAAITTALTGKANISSLSTVATSGSYTDLTNKPTIPTLPNLATVATSGSYTDLANKPTIPTLPTLATVATSGSYTDLINKPVGGGGVTDYNDLTNKPVLAAVATSGSYADLTNKPTIPSITGLASETYVGTQINNLINAAPATLDTLKEIADQLAIDQSAVSAITTTLASKANISSLSTVATTGSYSDLTNKPTIPTVPILATVATTGSYADLTNKPTIPTVPTLAAVATTGSYADLTNKPTIPTLPTLATVATSGSYTDLTDKPTTVTALSGLSDVSTAQLTVDKIYLPATTRLNVTNNGADSYSFDQYSTANPTLFANSGNTIAFNLNVTGHPFLIQTSTGTNYDTGLVHVSTAGTVTTGSAAQGQTSGTLYWKIPSSISGNYKYRCSIHAGMTGVISVATADSLPTQTNNAGKFLTTDGNSTSWAVIPVAPSAPLNVIATASSNSGQIDVSWTASINATSYLIYYSTTSPVTLASSVMSASTNTGSITGLTSTYSPVYIAVVSSNIYGNSGLSSEVSAIPKTGPTAPTITSASASSGTSVSVSWTGSSSGNPTPSYRLYYSTTSPVTTSSTYITAASSPTNLTGLSASTTYYFAIAAVSTQGTTLSSQISAATPPAGTTIYSAGQQLSISGNTSQTFFIDGSVTYFTVRCAGGGGGGGGSWNYSGANGAVGGYADAKIFRSTAADSVFIAYSGGAGNGGCNYAGAGQGGGASAVVGYSTSIDYVVGGGGGGGGSGWNGTTSAGGSGGVKSNSTGFGSGANGTPNNGTAYGGSNTAGTNSSDSRANAVGHAGGNGGDQGGYGGANNSTYGSGGTPVTAYYWGGGGGGGGWYGGAGGWGSSGGDGGGGGSSYVNPSYCTAHSYGGATGGSAGNGSPQIAGGGCGTSGGSGFVTISFS